jgi:hypothetical protein
MVGIQVPINFSIAKFATLLTEVMDGKRVTKKGLGQYVSGEHVAEIA